MLDQKDILQALQTYFEGIFTGDVERLRQVFHPKATLFGEVRGAPYEKTLAQYLEAVAGRQSPRALGEAFRMKPLSIDVQGPVASARTHCQMLGFNYVDYLSLLRVDGRWLIVNKTFTHVDA